MTGTRQNGRAAAKINRTDLIEAAAAGTSLLCLVHCLALPMLVLMLPAMLGLFVSSEAFHWVALFLIVPAALAAFYLGYRRHRAVLPTLLGTAGLVLLGLSLWPPLAVAETGLTVAGSLTLIAGHGINWRLRNLEGRRRAPQA